MRDGFRNFLFYRFDGTVETHSAPVNAPRKIRRMLEFGWRDYRGEILRRGEYRWVVYRETVFDEVFGDD